MSLITLATLATPQTILGTVYTGITINPTQIKVNYLNNTVSVIAALTTSGTTSTNPLSNVSRMVTVTPTSLDYTSIFSAVTSHLGYETI